MTDNVLQLHKAPPTEDIPRMLRLLAADIKKGKYGVVTTAAVVIGHCNARTYDDNDTVHQEDHHVFSAGPRDDLFTVRGLLYTGLASIT